MNETTITLPGPQASFQLSLWEDLDDVPQTEQVKLCRVNDPECEACQ